MSNFFDETMQGLLEAAADLQTIADNVLSVIGVVWYRPAQVEARGNPCLEVGDGILLYTTRETILSALILMLSAV